MTVRDLKSCKLNTVDYLNVTNTNRYVISDSLTLVIYHNVDQCHSSITIDLKKIDNVLI